MVLTRPVTRTKISTATFGHPVFDFLNKFQPDALVLQTSGSSTTLPKGSTYADLTPVINVTGPCITIVTHLYATTISGTPTSTNLALSLSNSAGAIYRTVYYANSGATGQNGLQYVDMFKVTSTASYKMQGRSSATQTSDVVAVGYLNVLVIPTNP